MEASRKQAIKDMRAALSKKYPFKMTKSKRSKRKAKKTYQTELELKLVKQRKDSEEARKIQDLILEDKVEASLKYSPKASVKPLEQVYLRKGAITNNVKRKPLNDSFKQI